jgi:cytochrome c553
MTKLMTKLTIALACGAFSMSAFAGGNIARGKELATKYNCASCHGADFNKPIDPSYPKLAGQHAAYLAHALVAYKRGGDGANGRANPIMMAQAKPLSDQDVNDIAVYLASLPGSLVLKR